MLQTLSMEILVCMFFMPLIVANIRHKYTRMVSVRYTNTTGQYMGTSTIECVALCDGAADCTSVNHNLDTGTCELTTFVPRVLAPTAANDPNWRVYYSDRIVPAIDEWQKSTYTNINGPLAASYATDGNRDNNDQPNMHLYCAHASEGNSYWGMEFERVAEVSHVLIFFRNFLIRNYWNTDLRLIISSTKQDSDNNIGTECAYFVGPPASTAPPTKITCTQPATGKFLKIIHNATELLTLCEVEVYSI